MSTLAGIDTTKVYHEFYFSSDQVKNLKCEQWFIHVDLINWVEQELNRLANWNVIKILYTQVYHYDFNHVKCLEIYYKQGFENRLASFLSVAHYKMPWKGETIYYVRSNLRLLQTVNEQLESNNLQKYLIKSYKTKVVWFIERRLTIYEFEDGLNQEKISRLDEIFEMKAIPDEPIFISTNFLFLKVTEPPTIMETEVLIPYHGQFLADLSLEDILGLELANKDYRLSFYDHDLDHDIQMHLQTRFPKFYSNKKRKTYFANEFTNPTILKYFIYKYRHCFYKIIIPNQMLSSIDYKLIMYENTNLKFDILNVRDHRVDIMSPENITFCSLTYRASVQPIAGRLAETVKSSKSIRYIRLDNDMNVSSIDLIKFENQLRSLFSSSYTYMYFEIKIRADDIPATLSVLLHKLLKEIEKVNFNERITVRFTSIKNRISNSFLNMFLHTPIDYKIEFKNIIFHSHRLLKWFNKVKRICSVNFINCRILLNKSRTKLRKITRIQNSNLFLYFRVLTFKRMAIEVLLPINGHKIVYNNCYIMPSMWSDLLLTSFDIVCFKNMSIELYIIVSLQYTSQMFENCEIVSRANTFSLKTDSVMKLRSNDKVCFRNMDLDATMLMLIADSKSSVEISNSRILCQSNNDIDIDLIYNYRVNKSKIKFENMSIQIETLHKILYKFDDVEFNGCQILSIDDNLMKTTDISIELESLVLTRMTITRELLNNLKHFKVTRPIEIRHCEITNKIFFDVWRNERDQKMIIKGKHEINEIFYFELIAMLYENKLDQLHLKLKDGIDYPFENFIEVEWQETSLRHIDWTKITIKSYQVNDVTIKLEYLQNGEIVDLFYELNKLPYDSNICEIDYF